MDHKKYQSWVSEIDELSPPQKEQTQNLLSGVTDENASLMVIEARLNETVNVRIARHQEQFPKA